MEIRICKFVVQKMNSQTIEDFLKQLGLNDPEVKIFQSLIEKGSQTVLDLSRNTEINRTKIYRIVEAMKQQGLVEEIVDENRRIIKAVELHQLDLLVKKAEEKAKVLRDIFPNISTIITSSKETAQPGTRVIFHRGVDGIRQMIWNTLQAKKECVGYTYRQVNEFVGKKFIEQWKEEFVKRGLTFRDIFSDEYIRSVQKLSNYKISFKKPNFLSRYIPEKTLSCNHQVDIYNDVVAFYNWFEGEVFGVEIHNKKIALMQKQVFEIVWKIGKKEI